VAQNDGFGAQGPQRQAGILERFSLFDARRQAGNQRRVRAQPFGRQLKAGARPRRGLVKQQCDTSLGQTLGPLDRIFSLKQCGQSENLAYGLDC
jgi:hypothetical protein